MKFTIAILAVVGMTTPLHARECLDGSHEVLSVANWSAEVIESTIGQGVRLSMIIENKTENDLRMVDGRIYYDDVLGRGIANFALDEDARVPAGETFEQSGRYQTYGSADITRIARVDPSDIVTTICVVAAVTEDGEVVRYPEHPSGGLREVDIEMLRLAVEECWNIGILSSEALQAVVTIGFELSDDARPILGTIRLIDVQGGTPASRMTAFEAGRRAIEECGATGFGLPRLERGQSRLIEITLDPSRFRQR